MTLASNNPLNGIITDPIKRDFLITIVLIAVVFLLYSNTLNAPWYFDDEINIFELQYPKNVYQTISMLFSQRGFAKLSFAMNYTLHGLYLPGFHLVNIFIHSGTAVVLYFVLKRVFRESVIYPFLCALFFAVHPVQTHAVTYIVQRMASLSGFLFLLALYSYIRFNELRSLDSSTWSIRYWFVAFIAGFLAIISKENTVVLPVVMYVFDRYFINGRTEGWQRPLLRALPFAIIPCIYAVFLLLAPLYRGVDIVSLTSPDTTSISSRNLNPVSYFVTQFGVIWTYLRILLVPSGIALDYSYPIVNKLITLRNVMAGTGLAVLIVVAFRLRHNAPRISFGIVWFFLTLSVESSFIPLDPLFIHRLYLPVIGFVIAFMDILVRLPWRIPALAFFTSIICIFSVFAWQRNVLWCHPVAFYEDNLRITPENERVKVILAEEYTQKGRHEDAKRLLLESIRINPSFAPAIVGLSNSYADEGRLDESVALLENGVSQYSNNHYMHNNLGRLYGMTGRHEKAEYHLKKAIALKPLYGRAYCNLGVYYLGLGRIADAEKQFKKALEVSPNYPIIHYNLGFMMLSLGRNTEAHHEFSQALKLRPKELDVIYNLALSFSRLGDQQSANKLLVRLGEINQKMAEKLTSDMDKMRFQ